MAFNLLSDPFAPFQMVSGEARWLTVAALAAISSDGDYPVEPNWPRADLNIATYEFLIGLLSVALPSHEDREWRVRWHAPPSTAEVEAALAPLKPAFDLDGAGPRFLQERGIAGEANPIEALLIDTPGANGQKKNADLLTHRNRYPVLSLPAAAMALYALQAWAPAGGAGNNTSMRGGGPLTALAIPAAEEGAGPVPLWRKLWANLALRPKPPPPLEEVFPWLAARPFNKAEPIGEIHPEDPAVDALHAFWGMPRRLWLVFSDAPAVCPMTGLHGPVATGFVQRPGGLKYGESWRHPLTPYRRQKPMGSTYSAKPKPGRFGYRDWVAATVGDNLGDNSLRLPAENIAIARRQRPAALSAEQMAAEPRIRVGGWAMNNMEAVSYLAAEMPLHLAAVPEAGDLDALARQLAEAGEIAHASLRNAVSRALFPRDKPDTGKGVFEQLRNTFYERTDDAFHDTLDAALAQMPLDREGPAKIWLGVLRRTAMALFDGAAPVLLEDAEKAQAIVAARGFLLAAFRGHTKDGKALYAKLDLPVREKTTKQEEPA